MLRVWHFSAFHCFCTKQKGETGLSGCVFGCSSIPLLFMITFTSFAMQFLMVTSFFLLNFLWTADINECTRGTDSCHSRATCRNTYGSYTCSCNTGYTGNGFSCTRKFSFYNRYTVSCSFILRMIITKIEVIINSSETQNIFKFVCMHL